MICRSVALLALLLAGCHQSTSLQQPPTKPWETVVELGFVTGSQVSVSLPLVNKGKSAFQIKAVKPSCSCVQIDNVEGRVVEPGATLDINAKLRLSGGKGQYRETVTVRTSQAERGLESFLVKAWILPPEKVIFSPANVVFKSEPERDPTLAEVFLLGKREDLLTARIESPDKRLESILDSEVGSFGNYPGVYKRKVHFAFRDSGEVRGRDISGTINANGIPSASYAVNFLPGQETPVLSPLFFGKVSPSDDGQASVPDPKIEVLSAEVSEPPSTFEARVEKGAEAGRISLHMVSGGAAAGLVEGLMTVRYEESDGKEHSARVPFSCFVR